MILCDCGYLLVGECLKLVQCAFNIEITMYKYYILYKLYNIMAEYF